MTVDMENKTMDREKILQNSATKRFELSRDDDDVRVQLLLSMQNFISDSD